MPKYRIAAVVLGGLFLASPAMAQTTNDWPRWQSPAAAR